MANRGYLRVRRLGASVVDTVRARQPLAGSPRHRLRAPGRCQGGALVARSTRSARRSQHGATGIELDVHATSDGHVVVCHDPTLDRTTDSSGAIADVTLDELRELDNAHWFLPGEDAVHGHEAEDYVLRGRAPRDPRLRRVIAGGSPRRLSRRGAESRHQALSSGRRRLRGGHRPRAAWSTAAQTTSSWRPSSTRRRRPSPGTHRGSASPPAPRRRPSSTGGCTPASRRRTTSDATSHSKSRRASVRLSSWTSSSSSVAHVVRARGARVDHRRP